MERINFLYSMNSHQNSNHDHFKSLVIFRQLLFCFDYILKVLTISNKQENSMIASLQ